MAFRFEKLESWKLARVFANEIYQLTKSFPKEELFGLIMQLRRAAVSIVSNIAEGSDRKSDVEFIRYLRIALTSVNEVVTQLYVALDQRFLPPAAFDCAYEHANRLASKINALINSLSEQRVSAP